MSKKSTYKDPEAVSPDAAESNDASGAVPMEDAAAETRAKKDVTKAPSAAADDSGSGTSNLLEQIEKLQQEAQEQQDKHMRTLADMDNLRRRLAREKEEIRRSAAAALIEDLLPSLDNLQIGLDTAERHPEAKEVSRGFEVVAGQMRQTLERHGLNAIAPAAGEAFDPNQHEAMAYEASSEIPDHHVVRVLRIGYSLNQRLLRPATVVVSSGTAATSAADEARGDG